MTLLRRQPRAVYHVYEEDEFLAESAVGEPLRPPSARPAGPRPARIVAASLLAAVAGAVIGLVTVAALRALARGPVRRPAVIRTPGAGQSSGRAAFARRRILAPAPGIGGGGRAGGSRFDTPPAGMTAAGRVPPRPPRRRQQPAADGLKGSRTAAGGGPAGEGGSKGEAEFGFER